MTIKFIKMHKSHEKNILSFSCEYPVTLEDRSQPLHFYQKYFSLHSKNISLPIKRIKKSQLDFYDTHINYVFVISQKMYDMLTSLSIPFFAYETTCPDYYFCLFDVFDILDRKLSEYNPEDDSMIFPIFKNHTFLIGHDQSIGYGTLLFTSDFIDFCILQNIKIGDFLYPITFFNGEEYCSTLFNKYDDKGIWCDLESYLAKHSLPMELTLTR